MSNIVIGYKWLYLQCFYTFLLIHSLAFFSSDDYIAIGADCEELGAQVEEYILYSEY